MGAKKTPSSAYRLALGLAVGSALFLVWGVLALGVIAAEGDRADLMYVGVLAVGIIGTLLARFEAHGMARTLFAMAVAQALVAVIALLMGKHQSPVTSVVEILGVNGFYAVLFLASAWLFRQASRKPRRAETGR